MTAVTIYVPRDAAALSIGAEEVAAAIAKESSSRGIELKLIRNGSRGACWLEPLVEVVTANGRVAYGPVTVADVPGLFASDFINGGAHPLFLGPDGCHSVVCQSAAVDICSCWDRGSCERG